MRNLLAFLAAVCLTVGVTGWYLGWYTVESTPAPQGRRNVNIEINTVKIGEDIQRGSEQLQDLLNKDRKEIEKKKSTAGKEGRIGPNKDDGNDSSELSEPNDSSKK